MLGQANTQFWFGDECPNKFCELSAGKCSETHTHRLFPYRIVLSWQLLLFISICYPDIYLLQFTQ